MSKELEVAIHFLTLILQNNGNITSDAIYDLFQIKAGNKTVIREHLKAINSILTKALKELDDDKC